MDVFISWTSEDRDVKNALAEKLREAGLECWDSDERCESDYADECIAAIHKCSVFIALISDASMSGGYVQNEVTTARDLEKKGKLNILVYKITDKPYTNAFDFLLNHISFVTGNLVSQSDGDKGLDIIVQRAKHLLEKRKNGDPEKPFDVHVPQIDGLKITKTGYFVEGSRDNELAIIENAFEKSNVLILTELFGFGKRSAIKKFVEKHQDAYSSAVIVHNEYSSLREFFLTGLEFSNINESVFENLDSDALLSAKLKQLEKLDEKTLLVIPNVKFRDSSDVSLCERLGTLKCRIVLMTQESADAYEDDFPVISVGKMQDPYLQELFFHHYARAYEEDKEALLAPLTKFFSDIGGHTKTVELTAASLGRDMGVMPEDIPGYLSMRGSEGLQLKDRIIRQIETLFDIEHLSQDEITALLVAACIAVPYVSEKNYRAVLKNCGVEDWSVVVDLDKRRWLDVDMQNSTVSMESLVARIILSKFPDSYFVFTQCMNYLEDNYIKMFSITANRTSNFKSMSKMEYFFTVTDLPECAQIAYQLGRYLVEGYDYDSSALEQAVAQFEKKYPKTLYSEQVTEEDQATLNIVESLIAHKEIPREAYCRNIFEHLVQFYIAQLIPVAKLISLEIQNLLMDFSSRGNRVMQGQQMDSAGIFDVEAVTGMSREQMQEWLNALRTASQSDDQMTDDDMESLIIVECCAVLDGIYRRDQDEIMRSSTSLLSHIDKDPEVLQNKLCADTVFAVLQWMGKMYCMSGAYSSAVVFCEHVLTYPAAPIKRTMILHIYIEALHHSSLFTDKLFDAYKELLQGYDKVAGDIFDGRADMLQEKKSLLLMYAGDLTRGQRLEEAKQQFALAWKTSKDALLDETASCAELIVNALIESGDFSEAVAFLSQYFTSDVIHKYTHRGNDETQKIMDVFDIYQNATNFAENDFASNPDPTKHISYYHAFSRKNNSLLEQKYLSVAERAMDFDFSDLTEEEISLHVQELKKRARKENILRLAPEAFALVSEAGFRVLGYRHHYVQYMGAAAMADGKIAEILNGEGKTYTVVLTAFLRWLYGDCVFVVDQSPYLTNRNYNWMKGIYDLLGVSTLCVYPKEYPTQLNQGITYIDLNTLIFNYLWFELNSTSRSNLRLDSVIIDEIDTTLVDGAETPYRMVREEKAPWKLHWYELAWEVANQVLYDETYYTYSNKWIVLNPKIYPLLENKFGISYADISNLDKISEIEKIVKTAILCCGHYEKGRDFFIHQGVPMQENKEKGIFIPFADIYGYFLCKDNNLDTAQVETRLSINKFIRNTVGVKDFFKKFKFVSGTTATAVSFRDEFKDIYDLDYISVPPHSPCIRDDRISPVYTTTRAKDQAILKMITEKHANGQPILVIAQSIEESEKYSRLLKRNGIEHKLLTAKNADESMDIIASAGISGSILVTNALVGRGADIKLGGDPERTTRLELVEMGEDITGLDDFLYSLPTPEQMQTSLYKKYYSILSKNKAFCAANRQAVLEAGGLCVIGTSFFPEPRTEQQTRGRSGRQGDVGESWVFVSLEDESLNSFLPAGYLAWVHSFLNGTEELDVSYLRKAVGNAQKALHKNNFSKIRNVNNKESYADKARMAFIDKRFDLKEGLITAEDVLKEWAADKAVLQELQKLQKGDTSCGIKVLEKLWNDDPQLQNAKGGKAASILLSAAEEHLAETFHVTDLASLDGFAAILSDKYLRAWEQFIDIVQDSVGKVEMKKQALERYLDGEKDRLLHQPIEWLLGARVAKK